MTCSNLKYRLGSQQDSCEVVQLITDKIKDNIVDKSNIIVKFNKLIKCDICSQYKICDDQNESMFISQSIIMSNSNYIDFNDFISNVLKKESIQGYNFKCDCINPSIDIQVVLTDLPKFLVIKVGRCDNNLRKINKRLELANNFEITTPMDLKSRCEDIEDYDVKHNYTLCGIILHYGNMLNSGHYVAYIQQNNKWFLCDDNNVVEINDFNINDQNIQNNSCVLLYIKNMHID
jgi:ubiquitin C-terminal hydrolase